MPQSPKATVLICVRDDWRVIRLLASLATQSVGPAAFRVVIVSTGIDRYAPVMERFDFPVSEVRSEIARLSLQRNLGLAHVDTEYFLTTDADCVASPRWIELMVEALDRADSDSIVGVGGGIQKYARKTITQKYGITIDNGQPSLNYLPASPLPYVTGANAGYRTSAVLAVNGYDESFSCGDDVDLSYRLGVSGGRLGIASDAVICHEDRESLIQHYRRFQWYADDQALLFKRYRHLSGNRWLVNDYPWRRLRDAARVLRRGVPAAALRGEWEGVAEAAVTAVEAAGVLSGDIRGSIRHRVLYV